MPKHACACHTTRTSFTYAYTITIDLAFIVCWSVLALMYAGLQDTSAFDFTGCWFYDSRGLLPTPQWTNNGICCNPQQHKLTWLFSCCYIYTLFLAAIILYINHYSFCKIFTKLTSGMYIVFIHMEQLLKYL